MRSISAAGVLLRGDKYWQDRWKKEAARTMTTTTIFSPAQLDQIINETIPAATDYTHTNAVVFGVDQAGAQVVAHFVLSAEGNWELDTDGVARHTWSGDNQVGAKVILKW